MIKAKKIIAAVLTLATVISASACSFVKQNSEEILASADIFAKCVSYLDGSRMLDLVDTNGLSNTEEFKEKLSMSTQDYDQASVKSTIAQTITYEVLTDTCITGRKNASVDVVFTRVDYETAIEGFVGFAPAYIEQIKACDKTVSFTVSLKYNKVDGRWVADNNCISQLSGLYSFLDAEFVFGPSTLDLVDTAVWLFGQNSKYDNTIWIELDLWFSENPEVNVYYVVSKDGQDIYTSETSSFDGLYFEAPYNSELGAPVTEEGYIEAGQYNIKIYREDGLLLADETASVTVSDTEKAPLPTGSAFKIKDGSFADIASAGWWDYDSTMASDDVYCIDTTTIAFSIKLKSGASSVYYAYYFAPGDDSKASDVDYSEVKFSNTVAPTKYIDGTAFLDIDYEPATMAVGTYVLIIAADAESIDEPYITAVCSVIAQPSYEIVN